MLIDIQYLRSNFRIETAVPNAIIQRHIDYVYYCMKTRLGTTFVDINNNPTLDQDLANVYTTAWSHLVVARLLYDNYVITGFGVVKKDDEFSTNLDGGQIELTSRDLSNTAAAVLQMAHQPNVTELIQDVSPVIEGFFEKKHHNLHEYNPYFRY